MHLNLSQQQFFAPAACMHSSCIMLSVMSQFEMHTQKAMHLPISTYPVHAAREEERGGGAADSGGDVIRRAGMTAILLAIMGGDLADMSASTRY